MRQKIGFALGLIVVLVALVAWRGEAFYLDWRASQVEPQSLDERMALIEQGIEIHLPDIDGENFPVVLLFHGCAGPRMTFQRQWAEFMNENGFAAVIIDSVGPRGYSREEALDIVCAGKDLLGQERAGDVLAALELMRADTRFDQSRLVLAGWSHGAWSVMDYLTMDNKKHRPAGLVGDLPGRIDPAGIVLFYPHCGAGALSRLRGWTDNAPMIAFVAGADEIVDPDECVDLFDRKKAAGNDIVMTFYDDAHHVFDDPFLEPDWIHWYNKGHHRDSEQRVGRFLQEALR